jgi:hypothetical protein
MENNQINADNGVNVEALLGAREALTQAPEAAQFQWRATSEWVNGTHSRTTIDKFFGLGEEQQHRSAFQFDADHPEIFAAEDNGATPAQNRNVQLRSVKATLEAGMDLQGILGIDGDVRNGFDGIRVNFEIDADASKEDIAAIVAQSQKRSAVFDVVTNPTDVAVTVEKS